VLDGGRFRVRVVLCLCDALVQGDQDIQNLGSLDYAWVEVVRFLFAQFVAELVQVRALRNRVQFYFVDVLLVELFVCLGWQRACVHARRVQFVDHSNDGALYFHSQFERHCEQELAVVARRNLIRAAERSLRRRVEAVFLLFG